MDTEKEIWKDIEDFEGYYQVSSLGNVRSVERTVFKVYFGNARTIKGQPISFQEGKNSKYYRAQLCKDGVSKKYLVHRLVAKAFIANPEYKKQVNHINGIKTDNRVSNLEWATHSENGLHSYHVLGNKQVRDTPRSKGSFKSRGITAKLSRSVVVVDKRSNDELVFGSITRSGYAFW